MKKIFKHLMLKVILLVVLFTVLNSCSFTAKLSKLYDTSLPLEEASKLFIKSNGFIEIALYKVDGKTNTILNSKGNGILYTDYTGSFNVALSPGSHTFEFVMFKKQVAQNSIRITFDMKPQTTYMLVNTEKGLQVKINSKGNKNVDFTQEEVPFYTGPNQTDPHGKIIQDKKTKENGTYAITRIDGLPGKLVPKIGGYNLWVGLDDYEIMLTPGEHTIEYLASYKDKSSVLINTKKINIEQGKSYRLKMTNVENISNGIFSSESILVEY